MALDFLYYFLLMKLFNFLICDYFLIFEHDILAIDTNNISLINTSTKITSLRISHMNSFIILSFCIFSSIILCLYAIFHNRQPISSTIKRKINIESFHADRKEDLLTINDSSSNDSSVSLPQTTPRSLTTNSSNKSF
jgi:hypothetical protein